MEPIMSHSFSFGRLVRSVLAGGFVLSFLGVAAQAEVVSQQAIFDALAGPPKTRSLSATTRPAVSALDRKFIDGLRRRPTRSLTLDERDHVAEIADASSAIDLEIYFDFNSAAITPQAIPQLDNLGEALSQQGLNGGTFVVGGHTDAKGGDVYNLGLSDRRSEAVKKYLVQKFHLNVDNLIAVGHGKRELKNTADPLAAENRRVKIAKMDAQAQR
jgi:outer membrane protein OmpA-like peptidoglycan-associated protein